MDILGGLPHPGGEHCRCRIHCRGVPALIGVPELGIGIAVELGVDGQIGKTSVQIGQLHREFHPLPAARTGGDILIILFRSQDLPQNGAQLDLPENAPGLDIGEYLLEVTYTGCQGLHLAQAFIDLLQPLIHQPEGLGHALLQGALQLFVHYAPHLVQLFGVLPLHGQKPLFSGLAHLLQLLFVLHGKARKPPVQTAELFRCHFLHQPLVVGEHLGHPFGAAAH